MSTVMIGFEANAWDERFGRDKAMGCNFVLPLVALALLADADRTINLVLRNRRERVLAMPCIGIFLVTADFSVYL